MESLYNVIFLASEGALIKENFAFLTRQNGKSRVCRAFQDLARLLH